MTGLHRFLLIRLFFLNTIAFGAEYEFTREIDANLAKEGLVSIDMDEVSFRGPLSILESGSELTPYVIRQVPTTREVTRIAGVKHQVQTLEKNEDQSIAIICRIDEKEPIPDRLTIETHLHNFERSVTVEASLDGITWDSLVEDELIFDYREIADVRNTEIKLPETQASLFRVKIDKGIELTTTPFRKISRNSNKSERKLTEIHKSITERAFRIDRLRFAASVTEMSVDGYETRNYPIESLARTVVEEDTHYEWDGASIPVKKIEMHTSDKNFLRGVVLLGKKNSDSEWLTIKRESISSYKLEGFSQSQLTISLPQERRLFRYRLVVSKNTIRPISVDSVSMIGPQYQAIWLGEKGVSYSAGLRAAVDDEPHSDSKMLEVLINSGAPVTKANWVSGWNSNPAFEALKPPPKTILEDPRILWAAIGVAVLALVLILLWAVKRVDLIPEDSD